MTTTSRIAPQPGAPRPTARAAAQRERILAAAEACFLERGFHAASMAIIAETAEMSPGLIYRYFKNKNAIIRAIIDRQLQEARSSIQRLRSSADVVSAVLDIFRQWKALEAGTMNAPLFLEMTAEATRDPDVADAMRTADRLIRRELQDFLVRGLEASGTEIGPEDAQSRAIILQSLIEGLAIRSINEPELAQETLRRALEQFIPTLVSR